MTPEAEAARAARLEREAAALRENLRRRKTQARAKGPGAAGDTAAESHTGVGLPKQSLES